MKAIFMRHLSNNFLEMKLLCLFQTSSKFVAKGPFDNKSLYDQIMASIISSIFRRIGFKIWLAIAIFLRETMTYSSRIVYTVPVDGIRMRAAARTSSDQDYSGLKFNSLATGKFEWNFRYVIICNFKQILVIECWSIFF